MSERVQELLTEELKNLLGGEGFLDHKKIAKQIMKKFNVGPATTVDNRVLPLTGQALRWGDLSHDSSSPDPIKEERVVTDIEHANTVSSDLENPWDFGGGAIHGYGTAHRIILDIDFPVYVVESSPGKSHLYIDKVVSWSTLIAIMAVFVEAGLVEPGYMYASIERGYTSVRVPWALKYSGVTIPEPDNADA